MAAKGLDLTQTAFTIGDALTVAFDLKGKTPDKVTYEKALFTVADGDVSKIAGKFTLVRVRGFNVELLPPVSAGGMTTYRVRLTPSSPVILFW